MRLMFEAYGVVEEVTVLRDKEGQSKGCAFIKFSNRQQAQMAINKMHGSQVMAVRERERERQNGWYYVLIIQGASSPLVVKYADTEKERQARRMQKAMQQFAQLNIAPAAFPLLSPQYPYLYAQVLYIIIIVTSSLHLLLSLHSIHSPSPFLSADSAAGSSCWPHSAVVCGNTICCITANSCRFAVPHQSISPPNSHGLSSWLLCRRYPCRSVFSLSQNHSQHSCKHLCNFTFTIVVISVTLQPPMVHS